MAVHDFPAASAWWARQEGEIQASLIAAGRSEACAAAVVRYVRLHCAGIAPLVTSTPCIPGGLVDRAQVGRVIAEVQLTMLAALLAAACRLYELGDIE